jgi:hypothetical protein
MSSLEMLQGIVKTLYFNISFSSADNLNGLGIR